MALNSKNFVSWSDPSDLDEFTTDGEFNFGDGVSVLPDFWDANDTSPIGDNSESWVWVSSGDNYMFGTDATNEWFSGLSQSKRFEYDKTYHFDIRMIGSAGRGDHEVYFILMNNLTDYEIVKQITLPENTEYLSQFHVSPSKNYNKLLITANNSNGVALTFYRCVVKEINQCYSLPLLKDDSLTIWLNGELDNTVDVFSQLKVGLWQNGFYLRDIATLNQIIISGDIYQLYFTWSVPVLPKGNYRFVIYDDSNAYEQELYASNNFVRITDNKYTKVVKYKNTKNALGYYYESAPSIYSQVRIDLWKGLPVFPNQRVGYQTYQGVFIPVKSSIQKQIEFETRFFDEVAHDGFSNMVLHDEFYIDDVRYKLAEDQSYDISWSDDDFNRIGTGTVRLNEADYSTEINQC